MDVKESSGARPGSYVAVFNKFIRDKKGRIINNSKAGPQVRYVCHTVLNDNHDAGIELPGSFLLDFSHYSLHNAFGAFGIPARSLEKSFKGMNEKKFFAAVEKKFAELKHEVNCWIPQDSEAGWIASIKPNAGVFPVEFEKILSRDKNGDFPIHESKVNNWGDPEDTFNVLLKVVAGDHEGATFIYKVHYKIEQPEKGRYVLNLRGSRGKQFYEFFKFNGIDLKELDPDEFADDPKNILPEAEKVFLRKKAQMTAEVSNGWIDKLSLIPQAQRVGDIDFGGGKRRRGKPVQPPQSPHVGTLKLIVNSVESDMFTGQDLELSSMKAWKKFVVKNKLPKKPIGKYTTKDVKGALIKLGQKQLADGITEE